MKVMGLKVGMWGCWGVSRCAAPRAHIQSLRSASLKHMNPQYFENKLKTLGEQSF